MKKSFYVAIGAAFFIVISYSMIARAAIIDDQIQIIPELEFLPFSEQEEVSAIITEQNTYLADSGEYEMKKRYSVDNGDTYEIHEYKTPESEKGYQIFIETATDFKSIGYGPEALIRTYTIKKNDYASSSPIDNIE